MSAKRKKTCDNAHLFGGMIDAQASGKRIGPDDGEENESEDDCDGNFLLPGDEGFEDDRLVKRSEDSDVESDQYEERGNKSEDKGRDLSHKEVGRICRGLESHSESEDDLLLPSRRGGNGCGGKKRKKTLFENSNSSDSGCD